MKKALVALIAAPAVIFSLGGCTTTGGATAATADDISRLDKSVTQAQRTADEAKAMASDAMKSANEAKDIARNALSTANAAKQTAEDAMKKAERTFTKAMKK